MKFRLSKTMFQRSVLLIVVALSLGASSCDNARKAFEPYEITLSIGETVISNDGSIAVTFDEVLEDSRCPSDVVCVWEGNAHVSLSLVLDGTQTTVDLNSSLDPQMVELDGVQIKYIGLTPQPHSEQDIEPTDYDLTLEISSL